MGVYKFLPHTADIRLLVTAASPEEMFISALEGMAYLQKKDFCKQQTGLFFTQDKIQASATDITSLLIDFLSEVLTLSHINKVVYCKADFFKFSTTEFTVTVTGYKVDYFDEDIKAVTYHEAEVKQNKDKQWETIVIFDI